MIDPLESFDSPCSGGAGRGAGVAAVQQKGDVPGSPPPPTGPPAPWPVSGKVPRSGHLGPLRPHCCTLPGQTETGLHVSVLISYLYIICTVHISNKK